MLHLIELTGLAVAVLTAAATGWLAWHAYLSIIWRRLARTAA